MGQLWQQIELDLISKLDAASNLAAEDYRSLLETIQSECEDRIAALDEDEN
jgi:hypothetical protein